MELLKEHADRASRVLIACGYDSVKVRHGNGFEGWEEEAPFDAVIVTAAPDHVPSALTKQLKDGGKMIFPVGPVHAVQSLKLITKDGDNCIAEELILVRFVPMVDEPVR